MYVYIVIRTIGDLQDIQSVYTSYSKAEIECSRLDEDSKLKGYGDSFEFIIKSFEIIN